jgi:hypothetical protein
MHKSWLTTLTAAAAVLALGLAGAAVAKSHQPPAEGAGFWKYVTETDPYTEWSYLPGKEGMYPGQSPHGKFLKVYVNDKALEAVKAGRPLPPGSMVVKENYNADKELAAVTPMYKVEGYDPDAGDYWWAKIGPDGEIMAEGKVASCIKCHSHADGGDYLFLY